MTVRPNSAGPCDRVTPARTPSADLTIRQGRVGDVTATAEVIAAAFADLDASAWLVPAPVRRRQVLAEVFAIVVAQALDHGVVHLLTATPAASTVVPSSPDASLTTPGAENVLAVAVWINRTHPLPAPPDYERRLQVAAGRDVARFRRLDDLFDHSHPFEPHEHLAFLATHPNHQGHGLGARLLQCRLCDLDGAQTAAYLEAHGPRNRELYTRHGFRSLDRDFQLPNGATFMPMWREPEPVA